jgi:hypothetical protein
MFKLKSMFGMAALAVVALMAFAVQGASAQTAVVCSTEAAISVREFSDSHCLTHATPPSVYGHTIVAENTPFAIDLTNLETGTTRSTAKLKSVQSGVTLELQATEVSSENGTLENKKEGSTTWAQGSGIIVYKNVTVTAPAGKGCKVTSSTIKTSKLLGTTKGLTNQLKFTPESGPFAEFTVEGCSVAALNHAYKATGSVIGSTSGTTTTFTHTATTEAGTLLLFEQKAGLEGKITIRKASTGEGIALT